MDRRAFVTGLGAMLAAPRGTEAQQARGCSIGVILQGGPYYAAVDGLRDGLKELGLEERKQFILDVHDAKGDLKAVEPTARSLEEQVDLIYTVGTSVTSAAMRATKRVPIGFYAGTDPVALGLVKSFREPGGRLTGIHSQSTDVTGKGLDLVKEMIRRLRRVVTCYNPDNPVARRSLTIARDAARQLKVELLERLVASVEELRAGLRALQPREADAFFFESDELVISQE